MELNYQQNLQVKLQQKNKLVNLSISINFYLPRQVLFNYFKCLNIINYNKNFN